MPQTFQKVTVSRGAKSGRSNVDRERRTLRVPSMCSKEGVRYDLRRNQILEGKLQG